MWSRDTVASGRLELPHTGPVATDRPVPGCGLEGVLAGMLDIDSFRGVFDRYSRPVLAFLIDMIGDRAAAEEAMQETFVRAIRRRTTYRGEAAVSSWLFGIARNVGREHLRRTLRSREGPIEESVALSLEQGGPGPLDRVEEAEVHRAVKAAVAALEEDQRLVFTLKVLHEMSYHEISQITGTSIPKLKTDLHRARQHMRRRLRDWISLEMSRGVDREL